jgi:hypothetical protein
MKKITSPKQLKTGKVVTKYCEAAGWTVTTTAKQHNLAEKDGRIFGYHSHGELKPGIRFAIFKHMKEYGIILAVLAPIIFLVLR